MNDGVEFFRVGLSMHESTMQAMASRLAAAEAKMIAFEQSGNEANSRIRELERRNAIVDDEDEPDFDSDSGEVENSFKRLIRLTSSKGKDTDKRKDSGKAKVAPKRGGKKSKVAPKSRGTSSHSL